MNNFNAGKQNGNGGNTGNGGNMGNPVGWRKEPMAMINNAGAHSIQDMGDGPSGAVEHKGYHYF